MIINEYIYGKGGGTYLNVTVEGEGSDHVGGTVTATLSGESYTATTDSSGKAMIMVEATGTYTLTYTKSYLEGEGTIEVPALGFTYPVTLEIPYAKYWAVDIAISNSDPAARCTYPQTITVNGTNVDNECYGYTPMVGSSSGTFTTGSWNNSKLIADIKPISFDGTTWTDLGTDASQWTDNAEGTDYFTEFPFMWLSITNDDTKIRVIFSDADAQPDSNFQCYAHAKGCDSYSNSDIESAMLSASRKAIMASNNNSYFANSFHIGCFPGSSSSYSTGLFSRKGSSVSPLVSTALNRYFVAANARGTDYDCMSFQQWTYLQALFVLLFKSTNSQVAHSYGYANGSSVQANTGLSTTAYGMAGTIGGTKIRMAFFWIHDIWGNVYQFIGGAWNRAGNSSKLYYWLPRTSNSRAWDNSSWDTTSSSYRATQASLGDDTGLLGSDSTGYIYSTAGTNKGGFCPTSQSGASATTYWCDYGCIYSASGYAYFPYVGGLYDISTYDGMFYCYVRRESTYSGASYGSRLAYRGGHI